MKIPVRGPAGKFGLSDAVNATGQVGAAAAAYWLAELVCAAVPAWDGMEMGLFMVVLFMLQAAARLVQNAERKCPAAQTTDRKGEGSCRGDEP